MLYNSQAVIVNNTLPNFQMRTGNRKASYAKSLQIMAGM